MKTLNEVIKAFSEVNKEVGCGDCQFNDAESDDIPCELNDCIFNDALHYLKLLKAHCDRVQNQIEDLREEYRPNEPLTWDELKDMEGKPVWVEGGVTGYWDIVKSVTETWMHCVLDGWRKETHGTEWQAYRKERECRSLMK